MGLLIVLIAIFITIMVLKNTYNLYLEQRNIKFLFSLTRPVNIVVEYKHPTMGIKKRKPIKFINANANGFFYKDIIKVHPQLKNEQKPRIKWMSFNEMGETFYSIDFLDEDDRDEMYPSVKEFEEARRIEGQ